MPSSSGQAKEGVGTALLVVELDPVNVAADDGIDIEFPPLGILDIDIDMLPELIVSDPCIVEAAPVLLLEDGCQQNPYSG